jgi:DNA polymerase-3 subunit gamma/tau
LLKIALAQSVPDALGPEVPERALILKFAGRFSAEEVQLYYQITVQGRQDLPLAPDEHSGFLMTLLRMHAFRPVDAGVAAATNPASAPKAKAPVQAASAAPSVLAPQIRSPSVAPEPEAAFNGNWPDLVRELELGGAAKLLADNSELRRHENGQFDLCIPKAMAYLADKGYVDKLKLALTQRFGGTVTLRVTVGEVEGKSVSAIEQGERSARQAQAADAVRGDPFVRDLVDIFDATVIDNTIHATPKGS